MTKLALMQQTSVPILSFAIKKKINAKWNYINIYLQKAEKSIFKSL